MMTRNEWLEQGASVVVLETPLDGGRLGKVVHKSALIITVEVESGAGKRTIEYRVNDGLAILLGGMTHPAARIDPASLTFKVKKGLRIEVHFPWRELAHFYVVRGEKKDEAVLGPFLLDDEVDFKAVVPITRREESVQGYTEGRPLARFLKTNLDVRHALSRSSRETVTQHVLKEREKP